MKKLNALFIIICLLSCKNKIESNEMIFLTKIIPSETPISFKEDLIPNDQLIHKGIFSPDLKQYYYTISDKGFKQFNVYVISKLKESWSAPQEAFFNSDFNEHGMSFSPDGNSVYFSSTRPTNIDTIPKTWHIWKSDKINGEWSKPEYVDIPNLRDKLLSHPIITNSGTLYFHSSNLDYSDMDIYHSKNINGEFDDAVKTSISTTINIQKCTPYVSPKEDYMIFASIGNQLDLMISYNDGQGKWIKTRKLNDRINETGQGNPYVTPNNKFLFYTVGEHQSENWKVNWVDVESEIKNR